MKTAAIDETSAKRGHQYISLVMDLDQGKVVYVTKGKDASTLTRFKDQLESKGGDAKQIDTFCSDLSSAYIQGVRDHFPNAAHVFDKFHVMKLLNETLIDVGMSSVGRMIKSFICRLSGNLNALSPSENIRNSKTLTIE